MIRDEAMGDKTRLQMEWDLFLMYLSKTHKATCKDVDDAMKWARMDTRAFCMENGLFEYRDDEEAVS